ncbi:acetate uptake transporter family protein ASCRUDRAFT_74109 [Ascoidea rubescens DSM 1968]|uniref:Uncharacterized protein n=1 Tax=Ascoidea rubescens DSM 1968 TaxID=1344418 RepID=A0A1D2VSE7_9ASCO|nr:hypothetical protein ASCRUDRAFT_74109 [Ascoidea rubescens DSM 1968]ODV64497.1 hypothetical protein ASCRUDRAFT_74109 [Ascoidea rubescens DSM 1968]
MSTAHKRSSSKLQQEEVSDSDRDDYDNYVYIGKTKVDKDELLKTLCLSKTLTMGNQYQNLISKLDNIEKNSTANQSQPNTIKKSPQHLFANPGPLGLCSFALTTFLFSLCNARAMGIESENIVAGLAFFYGGFIQFVAGIFCFIVGDTFGCCAFASYGGFWMSWGAIHTDAFGIRSAYGDDVQQFNNAMGFYNISWAIYTLFMALCTLKDSCYFCSLLWVVVVVFTVNGTSKFTDSLACARAGGVLGVIAALLAFFIAYTNLSTNENSYIHVKTFMMPDFSKSKKRVADLEQNSSSEESS